MSILHWLLINLAVVVSGTPITRYATFRNLDMRSSCHVGVLAKDKGGRTWVIQSNGNGTYSMTWDEYTRKWGSHKIKISEWMDSVDDTTFEGAVEVGNLNYDVLLDKCYEVRDAVVGYLSGRNGSLSMLTAQTCPPKKRYCGHDPEVQAMVNTGYKHRKDILISCGDDGRIARVDICDRNCTSNRDKAGNAHCQCSPNMRYCGHELLALGGWIGYDSHILFLCLQDGINTSVFERCSNGCVAMEDNSICSGYCTPNQSYCGHKLLEMGLKGYDPNSVYQCQSNGRSAKRSYSCPEACMQSKEKAFCQCHPGHLYCAHELITQMNWWWISDDEDDFDPIDPHKLGQCLPNKRRVNWRFDCTTCIGGHSEKDAYCQWTPRVLCGRKLNAIGWSGHENDILYHIGEEERNVSIISMCQSGTCRESDCDCIPNRTYCGHQLYWMGWRYNASNFNQTLWRCREDGTNADTIATCKKCTNSGVHARCAACMETEQYCGHELLSDPPYGANAIYNCNNQGNISLIKACKRSCARVRNGNSLIPWCLGECTPEETYCGSRLLTLGYDGYNDSSIYSCSKDGQNITSIEACSRGCITISEKLSICSEICTPNRTYCGWKLLEMGLKGYDYKALYRCETSRQSAITIADCPEECENGDGYAFCYCQPGRMYCVHELVTQMNWFVTNEYTKDYNKTQPHRVGECLPKKNEVAWRFNNCATCLASHGEKNAYCQWTPGVFCGRDLNDMGWPGYENDTLYQCGEKEKNISVISRCRNGTCKESTCQGCIPNRTYCGWKLRDMGVKGYDFKAVHRCEASGQNAISIANCSEKCNIADDGYAYCDCRPRHFYCVHELVTQMNWWESDNYRNNRTRPHQILKCSSEKYTWGFSCNTCIASQGEKNAYCQWTHGVFCGRKLNAMGWSGYENDTLYECGKESGNTSVISMCLNGTCEENTCNCIPTRTYCGHQLYSMGWSKIDSDEKMAQLNQCNNDGASKYVISKCKRCISSGEIAKCACIGSELFCGHELDADPPFADNSIYRCNNDDKAVFIKACNTSCTRVSDVGGIAAMLPVCRGECIPGETYCGSKLLTLGFTGYNDISIYSCSKEGQNVLLTGLIDTLCTKCTPGRSYCGHQLTHRQHLSQVDLEARFVCQSNGEFVKTSCTKCANTGAGAYCYCSPGWMHCGRRFYSTGWQGFGETVPFPTDFLNDTLFRCVQEDHIEIVEQCSKRGCVSKTSWDDYCRCTPGRTYCGHQLNPDYNSDPTYGYLLLNSIYNCSVTTRVDPVLECATCVSINGNPVCREQCIHGSRYCGSDLLSLEGWIGLNSNVLYQCTNGSFATQELNCTQGCQGKNGDVDAYCLGMPIAWYWILLATGLPLLFISLCLWLFRTIIKHRRLQKFVQQHRINSSQLTLVKKLGHGQFGEVHLAKYTDSSDKQTDVAVKISKHHLNTNDGQNLASANCFFQESVALDFLQHQNITRALGICSNLKMAGGITCPALVLEYMDGGNSAEYVLKEREHLQTSDLMRIFIDICQAGEHLQKMGVIHRDIGARNVLIQKHPRNGKPAVAKLTDFGLAKDVGKSGLYRSTNCDRAVFHERFTAPEGFRMGGDFSSKSDVWSFGVFMWELYMLMDMNLTEPLAPYSEIHSQDILKEIGNGYRLRRPLKAPTDIYSIMTSCWTWIPESRPTFRQLRKTLQGKRTGNGTGPLPEASALELVPQEACHEVDDGEQREEETAFSEQSSTNNGYASPR